MKPYKYRRIADRLLWQQARKLMRDRGLPLRTRLKARLIAATFRVRLLIGWHSAPTAWMQIKVHGNYCGPGHHNFPAPPVDALDEACRVHDEQYSAAASPAQAKESKA